MKNYSSPLDDNALEKFIPSLKVIHLERTDSTNTYAKALAKASKDKTELLVIADSQSGGRGRLGRSFFSPEDTGLYMSLLLYPDLHAKDMQLITTAAAVALCKAIQSLTGLDPAIKWVNDVYLNGKKVAGILTEGVFDPSSAKTEFVILGIGVNVFYPQNDFPDDIKTIAGALVHSQDGSHPDFLKERLAGRIVEEFMKIYRSIADAPHFEDYASLMFLKGRCVSVLRGTEVIDAVVVGLERDFSLTVQAENGEILNLISGEVSLKIK